jgi:DNA-binding CsgD family transcriptional regulator
VSAIGYQEPAAVPSGFKPDCQADGQVARLPFRSGVEVMSLLFGNADLTSKEWAIAALVFQGRTNAQIAAETHTREQVVEHHLRSILHKTGCWNRTEVALWYLKMGLEKERRSHDRREADWKIGEERRQEDRRQPPPRSLRAHEQREISLDE